MIETLMSHTAVLPQERQARMGRALLWTNLLNEPLFTLYSFLAFILYKELGANALQISILTMLKPLITILSFYWSAGLKGKHRTLRSNVLWAGFWMRAPFLLCPWFDSVGYVIGAAVNYMFFYRAGIPGWLEIIKRNTREGNREKAFSISAGLGYAEGVVLALAMGGLLDQDPTLWKKLFFATAVIGLGSLFVQAQIPVGEEEEREEEEEVLSWKELLIRPWKDSYALIQKRPDFSRFQWGFMICGFGIMLIQPALPLFAVDWLDVSYTEMTAAISIAKGLGFALSSPAWARGLEKRSLLQMSSIVFLSFGLFPVILCFSTWSLVWFYVAFFLYGIGQGGSHLIWNMSGPIFAGPEDSSRYTGVNVVMAGLRGAVAPPVGGLLAVFWGPIQVLLLGGLLCFYSGIRLSQSRYVKVQ